MKKILLVLAILTLGACSTGQPKVQQTTNSQGKYQDLPQNQLGNLPKWALNPYVEGAQSAVGMAIVGKSGLANARAKALARGRAELSKQMELKAKTLTKDYVNTVGEGKDEVSEAVFSQVSNEISSQTLVGSKQVDMFLSEKNELYVLVAIPNDSIKEAAKKAMNKGIDKLKSDEKLYQEFKSEQAQKELDLAVEKAYGEKK